MANIGIERKSGTNTWVWVVVAIVVIALLAWLLWPRGTGIEQTGTVSLAAATDMLRTAGHAWIG